jgi:hypothetical protein
VVVVLTPRIINVFDLLSSSAKPSDSGTGIGSIP